MDSFNNREGQHKGCFKFQRMWVKNNQFLQLVENCWNQPLVGDPLFVFAEKLKRLRKTLIAWNRTQFGQLGVNIQKAEALFLDAKLKVEVDNSEEAKEQLNQATNQLHHLLECEEIFWGKGQR